MWICSKDSYTKGLIMKRATPAMVVLLLLVGCTHTTYDVELSTEDQQLRRVVTEKYRDTQNPEHNRDTLLTDSLCTVMPEDLDNAGQYVRYESQMGTAQLYIEQIRGNDHPAHIIETGLEKVEEGVDKLLTKMPELRAQMETWGEVDPAVLSELPKIETFIDTTLRDDLKDLYIYCYLAANSPYTTWQRSTDEDEPIDNHGRMTLEIGMRMGQFLLQEEYLTADTLPMWGRAFSEGMDFESGTGQLLLAAILERKAGVVNAPDVAAAFVEAMESSPATDEDTEADDNDTTPMLTVTDSPRSSERLSETSSSSRTPRTRLTRR